MGKEAALVTAPAKENPQAVAEQVMSERGYAAGRRAGEGALCDLEAVRIICAETLLSFEG